MDRAFSLAFYTTAPLDPVQAVRLAAGLGYSYVGLRPAQPRPDAPVQSLVGDPAMVRKVRAACSDTGVGVLDVEFILLDAGFQPHRCEGLAALGAELGARSILVGATDPELSRLADSYARLCEVAAKAGLAVDLEFTPYTAVPDIACAVRVIDAAGRPANAGVLIDSLHLYRSGDPADVIEAVPRGWLHSAQICDASHIPGNPREQVIAAAIGGRLPPGKGDIDLLPLLGRLPADLPLSLEVPNSKMRASLGAEEWSRRALAGARTVLGGLSAA